MDIRNTIDKIKYSFFERIGKAQLVTASNSSTGELYLIDPKNPSNPIITTTKEKVINDYLNAEENNARLITNKVVPLEGPLYKRYTLSDYQGALNRATELDKYNPNWVELFEILDNVVLDPHVRACIKTRKERVKAKKFDFVSPDGDKIDDITKLFKSSWFYDFLDIQINAKLYGFSLTQFDSFIPSEQRYKGVIEVKRTNVRPDLNGVTKNEFDTVISASWEQARYRDWTIYNLTDSERRLGDLTSVVTWYIIKQECMRTWAIINKLYGSVPVLAKTELVDNIRKKNLVSFLQNFENKLFGIIDIKDEIEALNVNRANVKDMYESYIRLCDEQISKALLGSTMVLDNGSSRSQSETHENNTELFIKSDCRMIEYIINDELIPRMRNVGFVIPDGYFTWDESEKLTILEQAEVLSKILPFYTVSPEEIQSKLGIEVEEKEEVNTIPKSTTKDVANYYKNFQNNSCTH